MQDRLKYRFWHKPTNKMLDCYGFNKDFVFGDTLDGVGTTYNPAKFDDCILMQCTGLKDKNGKLIYEGDIVKDKRSGSVAIIKYNAYTYSLMALIRGMDDYFPLVDMCYLGQAITPFEVIGNIYENEELLEQ